MPACEIKCKTRGGSSPQGKPRVFFCCYPEDFNCFSEEVSDSILKTQNCAVWYFENPQQASDPEQMETDLGQMQLFVVPVTTKLLTKPNFAMNTAVPFALEKHKAEGKLAEAARYYQKSLQIREQLAEKTGTVEAYDDLAVSYYKYGILGEGSVSYQQKAFDIWSRLAEKCPNISRY